MLLERLLHAEISRHLSANYRHGGNDDGKDWIQRPPVDGFGQCHCSEVNHGFKDYSGDFFVTAGKTEKRCSAERLRDERDRLAGELLLTESIESPHIADERIEIGFSFIVVKSLVAEDDNVESAMKQITIVLVSMLDPGRITVANQNDPMIGRCGETPAIETSPGLVGNGKPLRNVAIMSWMNGRLNRSRSGGLRMQEDGIDAASRQDQKKNLYERQPNDPVTHIFFVT